MNSGVGEGGAGGGSCPPTFHRGGAEPPHFRASHAMNKFINASKEAMHLPVVQKPVAVAACESFTTRKSVQVASVYCAALPRTHVYDRCRAKIMNINYIFAARAIFCPLTFNLLPTPLVNSGILSPAVAICSMMCSSCSVLQRGVAS